MNNKYVLGKPEDFHEFIKSINLEKDNVGVVTHDDLDGLASGVFLQKILESKGIKPIFMKFLGYSVDSLKEIEKGVDFLIFSDWNADNFPEDLDRIRKTTRILVVDHHPINENLKDKKGIIKTHGKYCSSHALFDLAKDGDYFDTKPWEWLVCAAVIMDYDFTEDENMDFLKSIYPGTEKEEIWNSEPGKIGTKIGNALIYYDSDLEKVYDLVLKKDLDKLSEADKIIQNEIDKWVEKFKNEAEHYSESNLYFYYATPEYSITPPVSTIVSEIYGGSTIVFLKDKKEHLDQIGINSRNQSGKVKLGEVLRKCIQGFENSSAGGHDRASGGDFPKKYLEEFKSRLIKELKN
jgi:single-stranded DNA-specific DHH superfamily exonuclease